MDEKGLGGTTEANSSQSIHCEWPALGYSQGMAKAT